MAKKLKYYYKNTYLNILLVDFLIRYFKIVEY